MIELNKDILLIIANENNMVLNYDVIDVTNYFIDIDDLINYRPIYENTGIEIYSQISIDEYMIFERENKKETRKKKLKSL